MQAMHLFDVANCLSSHRVVASFLISRAAERKQEGMGNTYPKNGATIPLLLPPSLSLSLSLPPSLWLVCDGDTTFDL